MGGCLWLGECLLHHCNLELGAVQDTQAGGTPLKITGVARVVIVPTGRSLQLQQSTGLRCGKAALLAADWSPGLAVWL